MSGIGRNSPCPCGSGRKYKHCCMAALQAEERQMRSALASLERARDWLMEHYESEVDAAVATDFFGVDDPAEIPDLLDELPEDLGIWLAANLDEWLLADAELEIDGILRPAAELVLGIGGPPLTPEEGRTSPSWRSDRSRSMRWSRSSPARACGCAMRSPSKRRGSGSSRPSPRPISRRSPSWVSGSSRGATIGR